MLKDKGNINYNNLLLCIQGGYFIVYFNSPLQIFFVIPGPS